MVKKAKKKSPSKKKPTREVRQSQPVDLTVRLPEGGIVIRLLSPNGNMVGTFRFTQSEVSYLPTNAKKASPVPLSHLAALCRIWEGI